jgi:RNA polymerase sigma factor (sigma-70 family)
MNLLIDRCRRRGREVPVEIGEEVVEAALRLDESDDCEEALDWSVRMGATREYLDGLDVALREFVRLRFEEEMSQYQVMERLKLSRWRVRSLQRRVQDGLIRYLKIKGLYGR